MKLEEQVLTIEQARHLQKLGLNMSDAALCWIPKLGKDGCFNYFGVVPCKKGGSRFTRTYTLQEVLSKLPKEIVKDGKTYYFYIEYPNNEEYEIGYSFGFDSNGVTIFEEKFFLAVYKLLCWVTENGYLDDKK